MTEKKRGLGRGLGALLSSTAYLDSDNSEQGKKDSSSDQALQHLPIEWIEPNPHQPRQDFNSENLEELANSIRQHGILQPIVVRKVSEKRYQIIAGERRWRASQRAGLSEIPALIKTTSDQNASALALIENIQREDLNVIEEAIALSRLSEEFKMTHQQIADSVGKSRTAITNTLRLMTLNEEVKTFLASHSIEMGHARALLGLPATEQLEAARIIISNGLSVRQTESLIKKLLSPALEKEVSPKDPNVQSLEQKLSEKLGTRVTLTPQKNGKGVLTIPYYSLDELETILQYFGL
ncbi:MAG: ParB/RepB/Spo0J family partition protein [Gammaproteobacteria bacterium]|nr:ParB/RepB/Spo0J family partition protein [Gammaproteobacteria bacterium]